MHYVWMFVVGIVVGAVARWIMPGAEGMGWVMTGVLGVVGSFVGGLIMQVIGGRPAAGAMIHPAGLLMSLIGALIVLFAWNQLFR